MFVVFTLFALMSVVAGTSASTVSCTSYGLSACPYTEATTVQLTSLIDQFCGDDGGYPYYEYTEVLNGELPEGYYSVESDCVSYGKSGTCYSAATCNSALKEIVTYCDTQGFWVVGSVVVGEVTFSVVPCELA